MALEEWTELCAVPVDSGWWEIREASETGPTVAQVRNEAHARRLAACVNACKGIPDEALEAGVVWEMVKALETLVRQVSCAHYLIVEACGATNASILEQCMERARTVLAKLRGEA